MTFEQQQTFAPSGRNFAKGEGGRGEGGGRGGGRGMKFLRGEGGWVKLDY